jgi:iron complex outermembrane recepter protein
MPHRIFRPSPLALALSLLLCAQFARAQSPESGEQASPATASDKPAPAQLQTVVVTAQHRKENLQKTPTSVKAVSGEELAQLGLSDAAAALKNVVAVEIQGAARGNAVAIRGLGSDLPPGVGESAVSTNYDGVYNGRAESTLVGFYDVSRIEVLRGPQGTLYGRNATAGVMNVISNDPRLGKTEAAASVEMGNYHLLRSEAMANLPIGDTVALRAAVASIDRDGYLSNGQQDAKSSAARIKLLVKPNRDVSLLLGLEQVKLGGRGSGAVPAATFDSKPLISTDDSLVANPTQDFHASKVWAQLDLDVGFGTLTLLPARQRADGSSYTGAGGSIFNGYDPRKADQDSVEVRLASASGAPVQWVTGLYYYDKDQVRDGYDSIDDSGTYSLEQSTGQSKALFGQLTYPLARNWNLTTGLRRTVDQKAAYSEGSVSIDSAKTWSHTDWKLGLDYQLSANTMLYGTVSSGYRAGGFNSLDGSAYKPETLVSYETGVKSRLLDNRLQINASAYYYDYKNYQTIDFYINDSGPVFNYYNVPNQKIYGLELEGQALLSDVDRLSLALGLNHSRIGEGFYAHINGPFADAVLLSGNPLPHAPKTTLKLGYEHEFDLAGGAQLTARADLRHVSSQYLSLTQTSDSLQKAYSTGDIALVYRSPDDKWGITGYVKNVNDKVVKTDYKVGYVIPSAPRTAGLIISVKY